MAYVMASQRGWDIDKIRFEIRGKFDSLRNALNDEADTSDAFLWETFTTKPFHDSGEIRRIGEITTPWPCFMVATLRPFAQENASTIESCFKALRKSCEAFSSEKDTMAAVIAETYDLELADAQAWYKGVNVTASPMIPESAITSSIEALSEVGVLPMEARKMKLTRFVDTNLAHLYKDSKPVPFDMSDPS
jgi:hypothetical protein